MDDYVIVRNGVRHHLVPTDNTQWSCFICSLADLCQRQQVLLCGVFDLYDSHFECENEDEHYEANAD